MAVIHPQDRLSPAERSKAPLHPVVGLAVGFGFIVGVATLVHVVFNSLGLEAGTYVGDRPHFQQQQQQAEADRLLLAAPVQSRLTGEWLMVVAGAGGGCRGRRREKNQERKRKKKKRICFFFM